MPVSPARGFGRAPLGGSLFGYGVPAALPPPGLPPLLVQLDGTQGDAQLVDTTTGDYVLDASGNPVGWSSTQQGVWLALRTELGSSCLPTQGIEEVGGLVTSDLPDRNRAAVAAALAPLLAAGVIELLDVVTTMRSPTACERKVIWLEVVSGQQRETFV